MDIVLFYIAGAVAVFSTLMVITRLNAVHALLYLVVSLLAVAVIFYLLGAPFAAAMEVVIYAGAVMVVFVFVVMMLNLGNKTVAQERAWLQASGVVGPMILSLVLIAELGFMLMYTPSAGTGVIVGTKQVGITLFGPYLLAVELASMLLLTGLIGAYHLGRQIIGKNR